MDSLVAREGGRAVVPGILLGLELNGASGVGTCRCNGGGVVGVRRRYTTSPDPAPIRRVVDVVRGPVHYGPVCVTNHEFMVISN